MSGKVEFRFIFMGKPTTPETAPTPAVADSLLQMLRYLTPRFEAVVPDGDTLEVEVTWNRDKELNFNFIGAKGVVEAAGEVLKQG